jgi:hypothetical protein
VWKRFQVGGKEYAAMKLTLMLLVGSAAILVAMFALWSAAGGTTFDLQALAAAKFSRSTQMFAFPLIWLGFGVLAGVFPVPYLVARRPRFGADRGVDAARRRADEARRFRRHPHRHGAPAGCRRGVGAGRRAPSRS